MDRRNKTLTALDKRHIWHPFTQMADWVKDDPSPPLVIARARGNYLFDQAGKRYFDGVSSLWVTVHGHRKKEIDAAVRRQLDDGVIFSLPHVLEMQVAEKIIEMVYG